MPQVLVKNVPDQHLHVYGSKFQPDESLRLEAVIAHQRHVTEVASLQTFVLSDNHLYINLGP